MKNRYLLFLSFKDARPYNQIHHHHDIRIKSEGSSLYEALVNADPALRSLGLHDVTLQDHRLVVGDDDLLLTKTRSKHMNTYTLKEFAEHTECGGIIPSDGTALYAIQAEGATYQANTEEDSIFNLDRGSKPPDWATHVAWYNK
jgi:hypothetical protein